MGTWTLDIMMEAPNDSTLKLTLSISFTYLSTLILFILLKAFKIMVNSMTATKISLSMGCFDTLK